MCMCITAACLSLYLSLTTVLIPPYVVGTICGTNVSFGLAVIHTLLVWVRTAIWYKEKTIIKELVSRLERRLFIFSFCVYNKAVYVYIPLLIFYYYYYYILHIISESSFKLNFLIFVCDLNIYYDYYLPLDNKSYS